MTGAMTGATNHAQHDVILKLDGREIDRSSDLPALVADMRPGTRARLEILRNGAPKTIEATVA